MLAQVWSLRARSVPLFEARGFLSVAPSPVERRAHVHHAALEIRTDPYPPDCVIPIPP